MANTTVNIDIKVQSKSLGVLEDELNQINAELKQVEIGSDAFKKLSTQAQGLTKEIDKANEAMEGFTDDKKFMAADGAIKVMGGSLAGVVGVLGLIGVESDVFGEFERKAASAIAVAVGIKDLSEGFKQIKDSAALATLQAKIFGTVTKGALIATGIGAFVVALGLVVAYWDDITAAVKGTNNELEKQNELIESQVSDSETQLDLLRLERNAASLRGEDEELITEEIRKQLLIQQQQYIQLLENLQVQLDKEQATAREISLWEATKIAVFQAAGAYGYLGETLADAVNPNSEKALEIQDKLNEAKIKAANIDVQLATLDKEKSDKEKAAFDKRKAQADKDKAEADKLAAEALQKEKDRLQALEDIRNEYAERRRDDAAVTLEAQIILEETRALEELDRLVATEQQKQDVIDYFDSLKKEAREQDAINAKEVADKKAEEAINAAIAEKEGIVAIEVAKYGLVQQAASLASAIAGENEAVQIAAVVATQAAAIGQIISSTGLANAKAVAASPLTLGQPWVTINTISAGLSIASSIVAARKSIQDIKNARKGGGAASGGGGGMRSPAGASSTAPQRLTENVAPAAPQFETAAPTTRTYVLAGDVTSAQEADARISRRRTIG